MLVDIFNGKVICKVASDDSHCFYFLFQKKIRSLWDLKKRCICMKNFLLQFFDKKNRKIARNTIENGILMN